MPTPPSVAEIRAATQAAPVESENAFLVALERITGTQSAYEHLKSLLEWVAYKRDYMDGSCIAEDMQACSILLTELRAAVDRAQGKPLPGTAKGD